MDDYGHAEAMRDLEEVREVLPLRRHEVVEDGMEELDRLAAYIEGLEHTEANFTAERQWAQKWERVAQVLADRLSTAAGVTRYVDAEGRTTYTVNDARGWLSWAEKEADRGPE